MTGTMIEAPAWTPGTSLRRSFAPGSWPRQKLLRAVFELFDEVGVPYCVLNGYERLYAKDGMGGGDLDCIMPHTELPGRVASLLFRNRDRIGADILKWQGSPNHYVLLAARDREDVLYLAPLDLHPGYQHYGRRFFSSDDVLRSRLRYTGTWVPAPDVEFTYYLIKKLLSGALGEAQSRHLEELYDRDPDGCESRLAQFWSEDDAHMIAQAARTHDWAETIRQLPRLRAALLRRYGRAHPLRTIAARAKKLAWRIRSAFEPAQGMHVVLLGPDGVGKSTVIEGLTGVFSPIFAGGVRTDTPAGFVNRPQAVSGRPHDKTPRGLAASIAKAVYWMTYYTPGYFLTVYPGLRKDGLHVSHRYLVDALVDPRRYRYGGPLWLLRLAWKLAVKPDLIILLDAPAETIQARKREVAPEETARQCEAYRALVGALPRGRIVDATQPVERVVAAVRDTIFDHMSRRTAQLLKVESQL